MTTINRKWNHAPILLGAILVIASSNAKAEDAVNYQEPQQAQGQQQQLKPQSQAYDQQYKLPPTYHGKDFPNDEPTIGYHGTSTTAQVDSGRNGSYYYYYY